MSKIKPIPLLAALAFLAIQGCATDAEDREFFNRGWLNPKILDRDPGTRPGDPIPYDGDAPGTSGRADGWDSY
jgi:hypothetical protein